MKALLKKLFYIPEYKEIDANYILSDSIREQYNEQGYVVVKNIIEDSALTIIEATYKNLISNSDLDKSDFITSPNYGRALQIETQQRLSQVNAKILSKIFNLEKCYFDFFSILVLKSKLQQKYLSAHQDISFVDEKLGTTTFLWIPIDDIVEENGPITVLPKSHIWARWQKTHNRQISPLVKNNLWIQKKMQPIFMKRGDVLLFDASLIHGSMPNKSGRDRVAMNTAVCNKNLDLIHYETANTKLVNKFFVNENFWKAFNYTKPIETNKYRFETESFVFNKQLGKLNLKWLLGHY